MVHMFRDCNILFCLSGEGQQTVYNTTDKYSFFTDPKPSLRYDCYFYRTQTLVIDSEAEYRTLWLGTPKIPRHW